MYQMDFSDSRCIPMAKFEIEHIVSYYLSQLKLLDLIQISSGLTPDEMEYYDYCKRRSTNLLNLYDFDSSLSEIYKGAVPDGFYQDLPEHKLPYDNISHKIRYAVFIDDKAVPGTLQFLQFQDQPDISENIQLLYKRVVIVPVPHPSSYELMSEKEQQEKMNTVTVIQAHDPAELVYKILDDKDATKIRVASSDELPF